MATTSKRDPNRITDLLGLSNVDNASLVEIAANPTSRALITEVNNALITKNFDYVSVSYDSATQETYTFKTGGSGGTTVATVVVVYTDATKADLSTVTKT